jgi:hypothetical protein
MGSSDNSRSRWRSGEEGKVRDFFAHFFSRFVIVRFLTRQLAKAQAEGSMHNQSESATAVGAALHECLSGCRREQAW